VSVKQKDDLKGISNNLKQFLPRAPRTWNTDTLWEQRVESKDFVVDSRGTNLDKSKPTNPVFKRSTLESKYSWAQPLIRYSPLPLLTKIDILLHENLTITLHTSMYFTWGLANRYWLAYANYQSSKLRKAYNTFFWKMATLPISLVMRIACRFHNFSQYILKESTIFLSQTITRLAIQSGSYINLGCQQEIYAKSTC
jgi:hypothetical protein